MLRKSLALVVGMGVLGLIPAHGWSEEPLLPPMNGQPSDFAPRRAGTEANTYIRIGVTNEAVYGISQAALTSAGVAANLLIGADLRLFCRTQEVAIYVSSTGLWNTNDYLVFPGSGFGGYYTITNIYWLGFGAGGKRMSSRSVTPLAIGAPVSSYRKTVTHYAPYWLNDTYRWDDESFDHWTDNLMIKDSAVTSYTLATDQIVSGDSAVFNAVLYGYTSLEAVNPDHCTRILVNGTAIGQSLYDGQVTAPTTMNFAGSLLQAANSISFQQIRQPGVPSNGDWAFLAYFRMTYSRLLVQEQNALLFNGRIAITDYQVGGFTNSTDFCAFDISDPANAVVLTGLQATNTGGGTHAVRFGDSTAVSSRYAVCHASGIKAVSFIERTFFRDLASTNRQADYIVICPYAFREQVYRLVKLRYAQGLSVDVAPLPDIYNEFSYGIADAAAIKQFIGYAFHHWAAPPKYVLLAGAGSYDPKHNHPSWTAPDIIPVHMGPGYQIWTALDGWYATVQGADNVPDVAMGRIPVRTEAQMKNAVDKVVTFEGNRSNNGWRKQALLVADNNDPDINFRAASEFVRANELAPNGFLTTLAYKGDPGGDRTAIIGAINDGEFLVNYFGHGAPDLWSPTPSLLTTSDVNGLNNSPCYPIVAMLTCANGAFQDPSRQCLAETFLKNANSGAAACLAATGLATLDGSRNLANGFYRAMLTERRPRIGDCLLPAYSSLFLQSGNTRELLLFGLFGDPAMLVNPP